MSTIPDVYHSLDWFLLGERLSNVVRPTKQNNKQPKNVFFLILICVIVKLKNLLLFSLYAICLFF